MDQGGTWLRVFPPLPHYDLRAGHTALLVVDVQYLDAHRDYGMGLAAKRHGLAAELEVYFSSVDAIVPRIKSLIDACRGAGVPVVYCKIASSVGDCSDV